MRETTNTITQLHCEACDDTSNLTIAACGGGATGDVFLCERHYVEHASDCDICEPTRPYTDNTPAPTGAPTATAHTPDWYVMGASVYDSDHQHLTKARDNQTACQIRDEHNNHERLVAALREIAAYDNEGANRRLAETGSYSSFDEPGAVRTARTALAEVEK